MQGDAEVKVACRALSTSITLEFDRFDFIKANEDCWFVNEDELLLQRVEMPFVGAVI